MKPDDSSMKPKSGRITIAIIAAVIVSYFGYVIYSIWPVHLSAESARILAVELVASVGGTEKVCKEADEILKRFGGSETFYRLEDSDLKDYPAIAALGNWCEIESSYRPQFIDVYVGTHQKNYHILIFDSSGQDSYFKRNGLQLEDSCIYIQ